MIKIAIVGYGKMGKEIESLLDKNKFELIGKYDMDNPVQKNLKDKPDVVIEFSTPKSVIDNIKFLSEKGINVVCGTTGWYDKIDEVKRLIETSGTGFIYASNFSIGVNVFFQIIQNSSPFFEKLDKYEIKVEETHHTQKLDKPSGTAIRTAEYIINNISRMKSYVNDAEINLPEEINIISKRIGSTVGNHKVFFDGPGDTITIEHNAKSRRGFAEGALLAAHYIYDKKGFFKFEDIFNNLIQ